MELAAMDVVKLVEDLGPTVIVVVGAVFGGMLLFASLAKRLLYVCPPNMVIIFSGRKHTLPDGREVGFRTIFGGRAWRMPIVEEAQAMDLSNISVPMSVTGAYSEGTDGALGIPLALHAVANVKISSDRRYIGNAIERFLGRDRNEIARVAKETLEGHLRGVLATMTPEEVNEDRLKFAAKLTEEADEDLRILGLHLDTLKIQHVSDERNYLESIGRKRIAEVIRAAEVAESDAERASEQAEAASRARADVAKTRAQATVLQKRNELRQIRAELDAEARSEEERATAAAEEARAAAEQELQRIRGELEQLRLAADVTIPADAERQVKELIAAGQAATITENGRAAAESLAVVADAWRESGGHAMEMYVLQNLEEIFGRVATAAKRMTVREVNLIDSGDGKTIPAYAASYPATVGALLDQVTESLGVDIKKAMSGESATAATGRGLPPRPESPQEGGRTW